MILVLHSVIGQPIKPITLHVLAHKLPDEVEAAYLRGAYLAKRKDLMADWAMFCFSSLELTI